MPYTVWVNLALTRRFEREAGEYAVGHRPGFNPSAFVVNSTSGWHAAVMSSVNVGAHASSSANATDATKSFRFKSSMNGCTALYFFPCADATASPAPINSPNASTLSPRTTWFPATTSSRLRTSRSSAKIKRNPNGLGHGYLPTVPASLTSGCR